MTIDAAQTVATWLLVVVIAAGVVLAVMLHRLAAKVFAAALAAMLALTVFAARQHLVDIENTDHDALCAGQASFFGVDLTAAPEDCPPA